MSHNGMRSPRRFSARTIAFVFSAAAFVSPAMAADNGSPLPDLSGQWGRDMLFFEPPPSGPGPIVNSIRKADGTIVARDPCCAIGPGRVAWRSYEPDPETRGRRSRQEVRRVGRDGTVSPDLHNSCWPEPPPYVMALHFGVQIVPQPRRGHVCLPAP